MSIYHCKEKHIKDNQKAMKVIAHEGLGVQENGVKVPQATLPPFCIVSTFGSMFYIHKKLN